MQHKDNRTLSLTKAILPFVFLVLSIFVIRIILGGPIPVAVAIGTVFAALVAVSAGYSWDELQEGICCTIKACLPAILIMFAIGMVMGSWIIGGIVPAMIYYGLELLSPTFFLVASCLICSVMSLATGSSWSTCGTVGVALMGVGAGLGMPAGMTAGAIISGAWFGDKLSPMSDSTNLAPAMAGTDVFTHIRHMLKTTLPSYILALVIYALLGLRFVGHSLDVATINQYTTTLQNNFTITPLMFLPPLLVVLLMYKKIPALPSLLVVAFVGCVYAAVFQHVDFVSILNALYSGAKLDTGMAEVDRLLNRGGMSGMLGTICLIMMGLSFAGVVESCGAIHVILASAMRMVQSDSSLIIVTMASTFLTVAATGVNNVAMIINGRVWRDEYPSHGLHPKNLSRALEDSGTLCGVFFPYSTDASYLGGIFGLTTGAYIPFCFFNIINPLVAILFAKMGWCIEKLPQKERETD